MQQIDRYIHHLLEDLELAKANIQADYLLNNKNVSKELNSTNPFVPREVMISRFSGIMMIELPVHLNITEEIAATLIKSITELLLALNIVPDLPPNLPEVIKYQLIRDYWDTEFSISNKEHHIDFCHYHPDNCPYTQYCNICNELDDED